MKATTLLATAIAAVTAAVLWAAQVVPPALPPGVSASTDMGEAVILTVYAMEDQGHKFAPTRSSTMAMK